MMKPTSCLLILTAGLIVLYLTLARAGLLPYGAYPGPGDLEIEGISDDSYETVDLTGAFKFHGTWYSNLTILTDGNINLHDTDNYENGFPTFEDNDFNNLIAALWTDLEPGRVFYKEELDPEAERVKIVLVHNRTHHYAVMLYGDINIRNNIMDGTIGVHAITDDGTKYYQELCEGALGDIMKGRKQSQCQSMTGMRVFRIDEIKNGPCIKALDDTKGCKRDKDCTECQCHLCDTSTGNCVACLECTDDAHCTNPGRPHCNKETGCCDHCPAGVKETTLEGCVPRKLTKEHGHEKTNNLGSDQVRHKPGCTITEEAGSLGGPCKEGKCAGSEVRCNMQTNQCMCHGKFNPTMWYQYKRKFP